MLLPCVDCKYLNTLLLNTHTVLSTVYHVCSFYARGGGLIHVQIRNLYDFSHKNLVVAKFVEICRKLLKLVSKTNRGFDTCTDS